MKLKLGLIVNPYAGVGGSVGLKGSDGEAIRDKALASGGELRAARRAVRALAVLKTVVAEMEFYVWEGEMGATVLEELGIDFSLLGAQQSERSTAADSRAAAQSMIEVGLDLIVFVGGDGTARDIYDAVGRVCPVLGIPSGVKMHSGVFAVSPEAAGELLLCILRRGLVNLSAREIRDIDEDELRLGHIGSRFYGEFDVPEEGGFLQHVKSAGRESEQLVVQDIAGGIVEQMLDGCLYLIGPGSTAEGVMDELGLANTLLGVDAVADGQLIGSDLTEQQILGLIEQYPLGCYLILGVIGGQGYILGRGNQQFSPRVIRKVGLENIRVVASKSKITGLDRRPLLVDTNDIELDRQMQGFRKVITGYDDAIIYPVGRSQST